MNDNRYSAALAAGLQVLEIFDRSPGSPKHELLSRVVFVTLEAIYEAERRLEGGEDDAGSSADRPKNP